MKLRALFLATVLSTQALATSAKTWSFAGRLTDAVGQPLAGPLDLSVKVFATPTGGSSLIAAIPLPATKIQNGVFQIELVLDGADLAAIDNAAAIGEVWVEITDVTNSRTLPRQKVGAVPFASRIPIDEDTLVWDTASGELEVREAPSFTGSLQGDVTGTQGDTTVVKIQDRPVSTNAPGNGQVLKWISGAWTPADDDDSGAGASLNDASNLTTGMLPNARLSSTVSLLDQSIGTAEIEALAVTDAKLAANAVTTAKILDGNVTDGKLANDAVTTSKILNGNVTTAKLANNAVDDTKLANGAVTNAKVASGLDAAKITTGTLADGVIPSAIARDSEVTPKLDKAGGTMTGGLTMTLPSPASADAVTVQNSQRLRFENDQASPNAVSFRAPTGVFTNQSYVWPTAPGADGQVLKTDAAGQLAWITPGTNVTSVGQVQINCAPGLILKSDGGGAWSCQSDSTSGGGGSTPDDNSVSTGKIVDGAVTAAKLNAMGCLNGQILKFNGSAWTCQADDNNNVTTNASLLTSGTLADGRLSGNVSLLGSTIGNAELDDNAVTNAKVADDAVGSNEIIDGSIAAVDLSDSGVTANTYAKVTVDVKGRVTAGGSLAAGDIPSLDAAKITSGTFTAGQIPSLDAAKITSGTFGTAQIPALDAAKITSGTIAAARLPTGLDAATIQGRAVDATAPSANQSLVWSGTAWVPAPVAVLDGAGNLGLGRTPGTKLDVNGTFRLTEGNEALGKILTSSATGVGTWQNPAHWGQSCPNDQHLVGFSASGTLICSGDVGMRYTSISGGIHLACGIMSDQTVTCTGYNYYGDVGDMTSSTRYTPQFVYKLNGTQLTGVTSLDADYYYACAVAGGQVWCWGRGDNYYQMGDGVAANRLGAVQATGITTATQVDTGGYHACALLSDGTVKCWGYNGNGMLGDGTTTTRTTPVAVSGLTGAVELSVGGLHSCARKSDGTVWCWGYNGYGQLGDNTTTQRTTPVQVSGLTGVIKIAAASNHSSGNYYDHTCAVKSDNTVWCWGYNGWGQLADGTTTNRSVPTQAKYDDDSSTPCTGNASGATDIATGGGLTCIILTGGSVRCAGYDGFQGLGDNYTAANQSCLVRVRGVNGNGYLSNVSKISVNDYVYNNVHVILSDGTVAGWGYNGYGELGDGTTIQRYNPTKRLIP